MTSAFAFAAKLLEDAGAGYLEIDRARPGDTGPVGFVRAVIGYAAEGFDPWPGPTSPYLWRLQQEILTSVWQHQRTSVSSCHAIGKDFTAALVALTFLEVFDPSIVITTAPTDRQVKLVLWQEIAGHRARSKTKLRGRLTQTQLSIGPQHYAVGFKSSKDNPERFQGFHAPHLLYVVDEASGVEDPIYDAIEGGMSAGDARILQIGNPLSAAGQFYRAHHVERGMWNCLEVDFTDTPNHAGMNPDGSWVVPDEPPKARYFIAPRWAENMRLKWGEDNPLYQAKVRGRFPTEGVNTLISMVWTQRAIDTPNDPQAAWAPVEIGLDVARYGDDESCMVIRQGRAFLALEAWGNRDTMFTANKAAKAIVEHDARVCRVDVIGIGSGVFDRLCEMQAEGKILETCRLVAVNVAEATARQKATQQPDPDFHLLRDEVWWNLRETLRLDMCTGLPHDEVLMGQLCGIQYDLKSMRLKVERKEDMKARGLGSPDRAEAMMLAYIQDGAAYNLLAENEGAVDEIDDLPVDADYFAGIFGKVI